MTQHGVYDCANVIRQYMVTAVEPGMDTRALVQSDGPTGAGADTYPGGELFVITFRIARGEDQVNDIFFDDFRNLNLVNFLPCVKDNLLNNRASAVS